VLFVTHQQIHMGINMASNAYMRDPAYDYNSAEATYCGITRSVLGDPALLPEDEDDLEDGIGHYFSLERKDFTLHEVGEPEPESDSSCLTVDPKELLANILTRKKSQLELRRSASDSDLPPSKGSREYPSNASVKERASLFSGVAEPKEDHVVPRRKSAPASSDTQDRNKGSLPLTRSLSAMGYLELRRSLEGTVPQDELDAAMDKDELLVLAGREPKAVDYGEYEEAAYESISLSTAKHVAKEVLAKREEHWCDVVVRLPSGEDTHMKINEFDRVHDVKARVQQSHGLDQEQQDITFGLGGDVLDSTIEIATLLTRKEDGQPSGIEVVLAVVMIERKRN